MRNTWESWATSVTDFPVWISEKYGDGKDVENCGEGFFGDAGLKNVDGEISYYLPAVPCFFPGFSFLAHYPRKVRSPRTSKGMKLMMRLRGRHHNRDKAIWAHFARLLSKDLLQLVRV